MDNLNETRAATAELTTPEQRARFAAEAADRLAGVMALNAARLALKDAAVHERGLQQWLLKFGRALVGRAVDRRTDELRAEFFPQARELLLEWPIIDPAPHGIVVAAVVDAEGNEGMETVHVADDAAAQADETLSRALEDHGATTHTQADEHAVQQVAHRATSVVPRIVQWLAAAERSGRQDAEEEAEREQLLRTRAALMTCPDCGEPGRYVRENDIPSDQYDVRTAAEWLQTNEALTICDKCGRRWTVMV